MDDTKLDCSRRLSSLEGRVITVETRLEERSNTFNQRLDIKDREVSELRESVEKIVGHTQTIPGLCAKVDKLFEERTIMASNTVRLKLTLTFLTGIIIPLVVYIVKVALHG